MFSVKTKTVWMSCFSLSLIRPICLGTLRIANRFIYFFSFLFLLVNLNQFKFVILCLIAVCVSARQRKTTIDPFADFAGEPDLNLITEDDDRPPIIYTGDNMKAQITNQKNSNHGMGKFNYKWVLLCSIQNIFVVCRTHSLCDLLYLLCESIISFSLFTLNFSFELYIFIFFFCFL